MLEFNNYLIENFNIERSVSIEKKYTHSLKLVNKKNDNNVLVEHSIGVSLKFYDKDNKLLKSESIKFVNDELNNASKKKVININPKELENKFMNAKREILMEIAIGYRSKIDEIQQKLNDLNSYSDVGSSIIPSEFKNNKVIMIENKDGESNIGFISDKKKNKKRFDM